MFLKFYPAFFFTFLLFALWSQASASVIYGFQALSNNSAVSVSITESQIQLQITEPAAGQIRFEFFNIGPAPATIANVFFDDSDTPLLAGEVAIIGSGNQIQFDPGGSPPNLPAGNNASPPFLDNFRFSARSPASKKGVNPGEWVAFTFELAGGHGYNEATQAVDSSSLRIGLHVISIGPGEESESLINAAPSPATGMVFLGMGATFLLSGRKYRV